MRSTAYWLTLGLIFSVPWESAINVPGIGRGSKVLGIAAALAWTIVVVQRSRMRRPDTFHTAVFALLIWIGLTMYWSNRPEQHHLRVHHDRPDLRNAADHLGSVPYRASGRGRLASLRARSIRIGCHDLSELHNGRSHRLSGASTDQSVRLRNRRNRAHNRHSGSSRLVSRDRTNRATGLARLADRKLRLLTDRPVRPHPDGDPGSGGRKRADGAVHPMVTA